MAGYGPTEGTPLNPNQYGGGYPPQQPGMGGYPPQQPGGPFPMPMHGGFPPQQGGSGGIGGYPPPQGYPGGAGYPPPSGGGFMPPPDGTPYGYVPNDGGYGGVDPEDPNKGFGFDDQSIRRGFIRKVYSILMVQLTVTFGIVALFVLHDGVKGWAKAHTWLWWVAMIVLFVTLIAMSCCESVRRKSPMNFIFLGLFTFAQSFMLALMSTRFNSIEVLMAVGITAAVCLSLTLFAFQTKWDFTVMGGVLMVALVVLLLFGLLAMFFPGRVISLVYASLGALLFCFYLVYDTQLMMGGKHKYSISPEEYIFAALNLYLDIVQIFMYILTIIGASRD